MVKIEGQHKIKWKVLDDSGEKFKYVVNEDSFPVEDWVQRDWVKRPLEVLAYGGGTQSTAMLILIKEGKLPKPDLVVFSDTGSELPKTVDFVVSVAKPFVENELNIPFYIVGLGESLHDGYLRLSSIPVIGFRSCTENWKIKPQRKLFRKIIGDKIRGVVGVNCWLGITTDESQRRIEDSVGPKWTSNTYPLLDIYPITRKECIKLNEQHNWQVVKSGCFCCPYMGFKGHMNVKAEYPDLFNISIEMEQGVLARYKKEGKVWKTGLMSGGKFVSDVANLKDNDLSEWFDYEDTTCDAWNCFL
tara:strand:- start:790 stop:1695 length:906 start_codon:yes stop_codon:yes gene_type:complete